jgi:hypothetical protein
MNENMGSLCCVQYSLTPLIIITCGPFFLSESKEKRTFFAWKKVLRCIEPTHVASNTEWKAMGEWALLLMEAIYLTNNRSY